MIYLKTDEEIELMRAANLLVGRTLAEVAKIIAPGVSTLDLDKRAEEFIRDNGATPAFLGYNGFPGSLCTSVNDHVVHGIPSSKVVLKDGDIVSVDCGTKLAGFTGDSAYTFAVGEVAPETLALLRTTKESLYVGIEHAVAGKRVDEVNKMAELGVRVAHIDGGVPNIRIVLPKLNAYCIGQLFYFFEKAVGISGYMLEVNPFNQPGVEAYKKNMFALLEKPGFEAETEAIKARLK